MSQDSPTARTLDQTVYLEVDPAQALAPDSVSPANPSTVVAGLPLLARLLRQLGRAGIGSVALVTAGDGKRWLELVARYRQAGQPAVAIADPEQMPAEALRLPATAIYDQDVLSAALSKGQAAAPTVRVTDRASQREAERALWSSIRKSISHDGPVAYLMARPISTRISRLLLPSGVRPNAVTVLGLLVGLGSGAVAALGGYWPALGATAIFFLGMVLDCVDGELARITLATSRLGQWLDTIVDDLSVVALTVGMGVGLWRETGTDLYLYGGLIAGGLVVIGQVLIYIELVRAGGPIDTARYPWFFSGGEGLAQEGKRSLVGYLSFVGRRDFLTLTFLILAALGLRLPILVALAAGGGLYFVLLIIDRVVKGFGLMGEAA